MQAQIAFEIVFQILKTEF